MSNWWKYVLTGGLYGLRDLQQYIDRKAGSMVPQTEHGEPVEQWVSPTRSVNDDSGFGDFVNGIVDDLTGVTQVREQNELARQLAEEEYQRNLQSIGDTAAAYEAAGFNRNLMYSKDGVSYSAPDLQAYSGSKKLDTIMNRTGKMLSMIPALYQATAALESIDQAREHTKQAEIKTMADGLNLIDLGYKVGNSYLSNPFGFVFDYNHDRRHITSISPDYFGKQAIPINNRYDEFSRYADAALKNKFELLNSIGIKNQMNSTLNDWRGYQYDLDRRYGAAGRIIGMASQGLGAVSKFIPAPKFKHSWKNY